MAVSTLSHGMFLLPWGTGTRNEKAAAEKVKVPEVTQFQSPMNYLPSANKMKRKRGGSCELEPQRLRTAPGETQTENNSHTDFPLAACAGTEVSGHRSRNTTFASATSPPLTPVEKPGRMDWEQTQESLDLDSDLVSHGKL